MPDQQRKDITIIKHRIGDAVTAEPPVVSVVMPAYRSAKYIGETLESALNQTGTSFEVIVVNDGSPDTAELLAAIEPFSDRVIYIQIENHGAGAARNVAIEHARGQWIAFLDADDIWLGGYLASQIAHAVDHSLDMVYCDAIIFSERGNEPRSFMELSPTVGDVTTRSLLAGDSHVITSGTVVRRECVIDAGMFEWERVLAEDFHLWMRIAANGAAIGHREEKLLKYRVHPDSLSGDAVDRVRRSIGAYERVRDTIALDVDEMQLIDQKLLTFEADLAVARGKAALIDGDNRDAALQFSRAFELRGTIKLRLAAILASTVPGVLRWSQMRRG